MPETEPVPTLQWGSKLPVEATPARLSRSGEYSIWCNVYLGLKG